MFSRHLFQRQMSADLPVVAGGEGVWLIDAEGRRYLDACGGAAVSSLGHSNEAVRAAMKRQIDAVAWAHTSFFTSEPAEQLAELLAARAPDGIERAYLVSGGSEALEAALKLARQYFVETGEPQRVNFIGRWQSYHGNTLGALAAGGNRWRRDPFEPLLATNMHHVAPCHYWRWGEDGESEARYGARLAAEFEAMIEALGPETVIGFIAEPVVGATMGAVPAVAGYFARIREICDKYGILLILDEVMCGCGRTGTYFASEAEKVAPDIVCIAKGLGAGYQPTGAMLCTETIHEAIRAGSGHFQHGHTFMGHPVAAAASVAVIGEIDRLDLLARVHSTGGKLRRALDERFGHHPFVGDIRGKGLMLGLELVADRETKQPFDPADRIAARLKRAAMHSGLMCYPNGGTVDGRFGDHVLLAPPFILEDSHIEMIVDRLAAAMDEVFDHARAA
jgi:adenosylmethionine-8-amino-7-oxononanoate aminotransferase